MNTQVSSTLLTRSWFQPQTMAVWDDDNVVEAVRIKKKIIQLEKIFKIISYVGALITLAKLPTIGFTAFIFAPSTTIATISLIAFYYIGVCFKSLAEQHTVGITPERCKEASKNLFLRGLSLVRAFKSQAELKTMQKENPSFFTPVKIAFEGANSFGQVVSPLYNPFKDLQPRFLIHKEIKDEVDRQEIDNLLQDTYSRGIILELSHLYYFVSKQELTLELITKAEEPECNRRMQLGFDIQLKFLEHCFRIREEHKLDSNLVKKQLMALGFKWHNARKGNRALRPNFELVDQNTVVIRANFAEIPNPCPAVKLLAPYVKKIKIPYHGIKELKFTEGARIYSLNQTKDYNDFKKYLQEISGKECQVEFIEEGVQDANHRKNWQDDPPLNTTNYQF